MPVPGRLLGGHLGAVGSTGSQASYTEARQLGPRARPDLLRFHRPHARLPFRQLTLFPCDPSGVDVVRS